MRRILIICITILAYTTLNAQKIFYKSIDRVCNKTANPIINIAKEKYNANIVILPLKNADGEITKTGIQISEQIVSSINLKKNANVNAMRYKELEKFGKIFQEGTVPPATTKEEIELHRNVLDMIKPDYIINGTYTLDEDRGETGTLVLTLEMVSNYYDQEKELKTSSIEEEAENKAYGFDPVWRSSVVPGLGQIYKKQKGKGFTILASEAALMAGFFIADNVSYNYYEKAKTHRDTDIRREYLQDSDNWESIRNGIGAVVACVYIYNIVDAIAARNAVKESNSNKSFALSFLEGSNNNEMNLITLKINLSK